MKVGFALRSSVFGPPTIARLIPILDGSSVDSVWFPNVGRAFDTLDICGTSLGRSERLRVGTGVIRPNDYDYPLLLARLHTLSEASGGRFILGLGTGAGTGKAAIDGLVVLAAKLRADYPEQRMPPIFFAALKRRALRAAYEKSDGAILNFCPPDYVRSILPEGFGRKGFTLACYVKLFFAEREDQARRMLADEMRAYDRIPQYHAMFEQIGAAGSIESLGSSPDGAIPSDLLEISSANPSDDEVGGILGRFSRAGVDLPIVYPYVSGDEDYKVAVVRRLVSIAS